jgi:hypothetical protein
VDTDASVDPMTGAVTGLVKGSATIRATGDVSGVFGTKTITVRFGTVCDNGDTSTKNATTTVTSGFVGGLNKITSIWGTSTSNGARTELNVFSAATVTALLPAFGGIAALTPAAAGVATLAGTLDDLSSVNEQAAATSGLTSAFRTKNERALNGLQFLGSSGASFDLDDYFDTGALKAANLEDTLAILPSIIGAINAVESAATGGMDWSVLGAAADSLDSLEAVLAATLADGTTNGTPIDYPAPGFQVFDEMKAAGEPFDGGEVFAPGVNPTDLTNETAETLVAAAGGDV